MFSEDSVSQVMETISESQYPRLSHGLVELVALVTGLEVAREQSVDSVEAVTSSRFIHDLVTKWIIIWRKNKWKRGNGGRLTLPITLLKRLFNLLKVSQYVWVDEVTLLLVETKQILFCQVMNVNVVLIARGSCPEIVMAETLAKQSCLGNSLQSILGTGNSSAATGPHKNFNSFTSGPYLAGASNNLCKQMEQKIASEMKQRQKVNNRKKLKRQKFGTMRKKLQI